MRTILAFLFAFATSVPALSQESAVPTPHLDRGAVSGVLSRAVDGFIRPGYHALQQSAADMHTSMDALCSAPSAGTLASAITAFGQLVGAWSHIEIVRVGPVLERNRFERILFYPDRKSTGLKQVQSQLAKPDESATSPKALAQKSVAMQGLGALEFVLYGTGAEVLSSEKGGFRCRYGAAIAANIETIAAELVAAWDEPAGVQAAWKAPGPDNPVFRDENEAATALLGILVHGMETVRDQRVETFYRGGDARSFPRQAIYWRSGLTWASIAANIEGLQMLIDRSDMRRLLDEDQRSIIDSIDFLLKSVRRTSLRIDTDIELAVEKPEERSRLDYVLLNTKDLILRLSNDFGGAIGLGAGFSFSDGD